MDQLGEPPASPRARFERFISIPTQPGKDSSKEGLLHLSSLTRKDALLLFEALELRRLGGSVRDAQVKYHSILGKLWPLDRRFPDDPQVLWKKLKHGICLSAYRIDRKTQEKTERGEYLRKQLLFRAVAKRKQVVQAKAIVRKTEFKTLKELEQLIMPTHRGFCGAFAVRLFADAATAKGARAPSKLSCLYPALLEQIIEYVPIFAGQILCSTRCATDISALDVESLVRIIGHPLRARHSLSWLNIKLPFELSYEDALALHDRVVSGGGSVPQWKQLLVALDSSSSHSWRRKSRVQLDTLIAMHKMCQDHETNGTTTPIPSNSSTAPNNIAISVSHASSSPDSQVTRAHTVTLTDRRYRAEIRAGKREYSELEGRLATSELNRQAAEEALAVSERLKKGSNKRARQRGQELKRVKQQLDVANQCKEQHQRMFTRATPREARAATNMISRSVNLSKKQRKMRMAIARQSKLVKLADQDRKTARRFYDGMKKKKACASV